MPVHEHILTIHQRRAQDSLTRLLEAYLRGDISHESELLARLTDEYASLFAGLKDPTITPEPMRVDGFLRVSAIKKPMVQLDSDLEVAYGQLERLRAAVVQSSNICAIERSGLEQLLSIAQERVIETRAWTSDSDPAFRWASDTFKTNTKINIDATSAWIDTTLGVATLAVTGEESLSDAVSRISIRHAGPEVSEVDGLPGNWLEIAADAGSSVLSEVKEPVAVTYASQTYKPSMNPAVMFDSDPTTWFEWERYLIPKVQNLSMRGDTAWVKSSGTTGESKELFGPNGVTADYGWQYIVHWPAENSTEDAPHWIVTPTDWNGTGNAPSGQSLTLFMEIEFESPQPLSWIELLPYLVHDTIYKLTSVQVSSDGVNDWVELMSRPLSLVPTMDQPIDVVHEGIPVKDHRGIAVVPCRLSQVKTLRVTLSQEQPYPTTIAHKYYLKTTVIQKNKSSWFGLKKSSSSQTKKTRVPDPTLNPANNSGGAFLGWGTKTTTTDTDLDTYYDLFGANRFCIGVRDLSLMQRGYASSSKLISRAHRFDANITAASIIASEIIPEDWDTSKKWVTYEISHDGTNWQTITPQNTEGSADGVIHFPATKILYLRVTLTRPEDRPTETPVLQYYAIKAIPEATA